jgi:hypothetical protein
MRKRSLVNLTGRASTRASMVLASLSCAILLAMASPALAGGFQISVETPAGSKDAQMKDVVLIARTFGCHQPADAKLSATAEGFLNGNRRSLPLELRSIGSGVYAIKKQWPSEGRWVLAITGAYNTMISSVLVELDSTGNVLPGTRLQEGYLKGVNAKGARRAWGSEDIDAALRSPGGITGSTASEPNNSGASRLAPITWFFAGLGGSALTIGFIARRRRGQSPTVASL